MASDVPGEPILLVDDADRQIGRLVGALSELPPDLPEWVLVGGVAVFVRLARVHRATSDLDTVSRDQTRMVEILLSQGLARRRRQARLSIAGVDVDVLDAPGSIADSSSVPERAFQLVRQFALARATPETIRVAGRSPGPATSARIRVADAASLVALKAVAIPRRSGSNRLTKVISDSYDVMRLVARHGPAAILSGLGTAPPELRTYVGGVLIRRFDPVGDGRYLAASMRRAGIAGMETDDLTLVAELGHLLLGP